MSLSVCSCMRCLLVAHERCVPASRPEDSSAPANCAHCGSDLAPDFLGDSASLPYVILRRMASRLYGRDEVVERLARSVARLTLVTGDSGIGKVRGPRSRGGGSFVRRAREYSQPLVCVTVYEPAALAPRSRDCSHDCARVGMSETSSFGGKATTRCRGGCRSSPPQLDDRVVWARRGCSGSAFRFRRAFALSCRSARSCCRVWRTCCLISGRAKKRPRVVCATW